MRKVHHIQKLYTLGEVGKKYHVPLSAVYEWGAKIRKVYYADGRKNGFIPIPTDKKYLQFGFPDYLVDMFPEVPSIDEAPEMRIMLPDMDGEMHEVVYEPREAERQVTTKKVSDFLNSATNPEE